MNEWQDLMRAVSNESLEAVDWIERAEARLAGCRQRVELRLASMSPNSPDGKTAERVLMGLIRAGRHLTAAAMDIPNDVWAERYGVFAPDAKAAKPEFAIPAHAAPEAVPA